MMQVQICRTCLKRSSIVEELGNGEDSLKSQLVYCVPDIDLTINNSSHMCCQCVRALKASFKFLKMCRDTEDMLKEMHQAEHGEISVPAKRIRLSNDILSPDDKTVMKSTERTEIINENQHEEDSSEMEYILNAFEQPIIIAPDNLPPLSGSVLTIMDIDSDNLAASGDCTNSLKQNEIDKAFCEEDEKLNCKLCGKSFSLEENLKFHEKNHNNSNLFQCNTCSQTFADTAALMRHIPTHKSSPKMNSKTVECEVCGNYAHLTCMAKHEALHKVQTTFDCRICSKGFDKKGVLVYHIRMHTEQEKQAASNWSDLGCVVCEVRDKTKEVKIRASFDQRENKDECQDTEKFKTPAESCRDVKMPLSFDITKPYQHLMKQVSVSIEKLESIENKKVNTDGDKNVSSCKKPITIQLSLNSMKHKQPITDKDTASTDDEEPTVALSDDSSNESIEIVEEFRPPKPDKKIILSCEICFQSFPTSSILVAHYNQHSELQCIDCNSFHRSIHDLLMHEALKHMKQRFECMKCLLCFCTKAAFIEHVARHDAPAKPTACKVCFLDLAQKYFKFMPNFRLNIDKESFQCAICCKILQFVDFTSRRCNICDERFDDEAGAKAHQDLYKWTTVKCSCNEYFHSSDGFKNHVIDGSCVISQRRILNNES